ncbi:MAG: TlpA family protein disulfide reductase [Leptospiraceae bacterium]|nr:TlpA family protein disulfide reductase [Leptospiraceae bacterium]
MIKFLTYDMKLSQISFLLFTLSIFLFFLYLSNCKSKKELKYLEIEVYDWNGNKHQLKNYKGRLLVLEFWATWCEPCKKAAPIVEKVRKQVQTEQTVFLGVNTDSNKTLEELRQTAKSFGMKYTSLLDPAMELTDALEVEGLPALLILNKEGEVIHKQYGVLPSDFYKLVNFIELNQK